MTRYQIERTATGYRAAVTRNGLPVWREYPTLAAAKEWLAEQMQLHAEDDE